MVTCLLQNAFKSWFISYRKRLDIFFDNSHHGVVDSHLFQPLLAQCGGIDVNTCFHLVQSPEKVTNESIFLFHLSNYEMQYSYILVFV